MAMATSAASGPRGGGASGGTANARRDTGAGASGLQEDFSESLRIPFLPRSTPMAPQPGLHLPLYPHQRRSLHRMIYIEEHMDEVGTEWGTFLSYAPKGGVLCEEVGLGKTSTTLGLFTHGARDAAQGANLVVTPLHLFKQWRSEIDKFAAGKLRVIEGLRAFRASVADEAGRAALDNRTVVLVDIEEVTQRSHAVWYDFRRIFKLMPDGKAGKEIRLGPGEVQRYREAATSISGGYKGRIFDSVLHMPSKPWRRVVFDEVHELVRFGSSTQDCLIQLVAKATNVWHVTATPFPHGDDSIRGLHQILGFKRLRLYCQQRERLPANHPFEVIKRTLYIRNPPSVKLDCVRQTLQVSETRVAVELGQAERALYLARLAAADHTDPFKLQQLRKMICHVAADDELLAAMGGRKRASNLVGTNIDSIVNRMMAGQDRREVVLETQLREIEVQLRGVSNSVALAEEINTFGLLMLDEARIEERLRPDARGRYEIRDVGGRMVSTTAAILSFAKGMLKDAARRALLHRTSAAMVPGLEERAGETRRKFNSLQRQQAFHRNIVATLKAASESNRALECIICSEEVTTVSLAPCGHYTCQACMGKWMLAQPTCPSCRKPLQPRDVTAVLCQKSKPAERVDPCATAYGSKPAALLRFLKSKILATDSKALIFSMWDDVLHILSGTLTDNGVKNTFCEGSKQAQMQAMQAFRDPKNDCQVMMLSSLHSASGANLQIADHVILFDPPGFNAMHGLSLESQAIGRTVRMGQTQPVTIVRFVVQDTIEEALFGAIQNASDQQAETEKAAIAEGYVCASLGDVAAPPARRRRSKAKGQGKGKARAEPPGGAVAAMVVDAGVGASAAATGAAAAAGHGTSSKRKREDAQKRPQPRDQLKRPRAETPPRPPPLYIDLTLSDTDDD